MCADYEPVYWSFFESEVDDAESVPSAQGPVVAGVSGFDVAEEVVVCEEVSVNGALLGSDHRRDWHFGQRFGSLAVLCSHL